ncbi:uncharacterized protein BDW43DRAFT_310909 [Aspergillus alliaceus]|uniref:uncharacterized protein n=1 Tax=Petromyces alliaceus TaxID=209559 RepID=UPI0012A72079|nr:uncharacterized protein BDW43DRAFT_310909 [Aspergillus alliaceus]KAB8233913.1 hypothetical protein BDW43DRAFT_310909 [Aspergillus alliaceus]
MDRDAGADETAWTSASEARRVDFDDTKPSFMSTPSPVHEANATSQPAMLHRLLYTLHWLDATHLALMSGPVSRAFTSMKT